MKLDAIDVDSGINSVKELLKKEKDLSHVLRSALEVLLVLVALLLNRMTFNSKNSSKPSSKDPNRKKSSKQGQPRPNCRCAGVSARRNPLANVSHSHAPAPPTKSGQRISCLTAVPGRVIKSLTIVDDTTHESVTVVPERAIVGLAVTRILDTLATCRGLP